MNSNEADQTVVSPPPAEFVWWSDPERPWWAKLRRAGVHIAALSTAVDDLKRAGAVVVEEEPGDEPNVVIYRARIQRQPSADLVTIVGDAVHNLRSALDSVAYGLAEQHLGSLAETEEQATSFPIHEDERAFAKWASGKQRDIAVGDLYGTKGIAALEAVQPFALSMEAERHGVVRARSRGEDLTADAGYRLNQLWNVDKHRRLTNLDWYYGGMWCSGEPGACRQVLPNRSRNIDGQVLARHHYSVKGEQ
ncbi:MAG: hypothetical protein ACRCYU_21435 [Nocardioides sp.]